MILRIVSRSALLAALLFTALAPAQAAECTSSGLKLVERPLLQFGDSVTLVASGDCLTKINEQGQKVGGAGKAVTLYLDAVEMKGLAVTPLLGVPGQLQLSIELRRSPEDADSRKSWDTLLAKQNMGYPMKLPVALAIGTDPPVVVADNARLVFTTVRGGEKMVLGVTVAGVLAIVVAFLVLIRGNALRDGWGGAFSLGKSQMAFWGLMVFLAFLAVWVITGTMERIPPQTLTLLGISGVTGLAAVFIGNAKDTVAEATAKLDAERAELVAKQAAGTATARELQRIVDIDRTLQAMAEHASQPHRSFRDFLRDICDDGTGMSFHRVQVVIWTLLLGAVFISSVTNVISMPEFPETLLLLMGISNGTYLGFKIPEKT